MNCIYCHQPVSDITDYTISSFLKDCRRCHTYYSLTYDFNKFSMIELIYDIDNVLYVLNIYPAEPSVSISLGVISDNNIYKTKVLYKQNKLEWVFPDHPPDILVRLANLTVYR